MWSKRSNAMKLIRNLFTLTALALLLAACTTAVKPAAAPAASTAAPPAAATVAAPPPAAAVNPLDDPSSPLAQRVVYFDFDKSDIKPEYLDTLTAHAKYL